ncbi:MAG: conjugal transfer protein TraN [Betaproteobacteria bacterium]|nr:conjugal transfer protein TraN [Betaproteobacteria bacterium]
MPVAQSSYVENVVMSGSKHIFTGFEGTGGLLTNMIQSALTTAGLSSAAAGTIAGGITSAGTFGVTVSYVGAGAGVGGSGFAFAFNPVGFVIAIIILVITMLLECDDDDFVTGAMRKQGLCHRVGSWCASKSLGGCYERKEGYCCFPSKLARIIHQQARPQIGMGWGSAKSPECRGFTEAELARIDFDKIDFSEFIGDIIRHMPSNKDSSFAQERAMQNIIDTAKGLGNYYD